MTAGEPDRRAPQPPISGRELRALTRTATEAHGGGSVGEVIGEVYTMVFSLVVSIAVAFGLVQALNTGLRPTTTEANLDPGWLALVVGLVAVGAGISIAARFGPMGMAGGQSAWWLPTPADRRGLLRPRLMAVAGIALVTGAVVGAAVGLLGDADGAGGLPWLAAAVGGTLGSAAVLLVARTQVRRRARGRGQHPAVAVGELLMLLGPLLALAVVLFAPPPPSARTTVELALVAAAFAVTSVGLLLDVDRRLDAVPGSDLRERGAVTAYAAGAAQSLDTRELGRALSITAQPDARRRSGSFEWVRGPVAAIVTGDALVTLRSRRQVIGVLTSVLIPVVVALSGWASWTMVVAVIAAGYGGALATAEGARRAEMAPVLDRAFPIEASSVRRIRLIWPMTVSALWTAITVGTWAVLSDLDPVAWVPLALVAGPALAAGAVRGAYRQPTDWSKPLLSNPMGPPIPPGLFSTFSRGPDIVLLCLIPLILGMVAVASPVTLFPWQLGTTLLALAIAARVPDPKGAFAQAMKGSGR